MNRLRLYIMVVFGFVVLVMICMVVWNIVVFRDCMAHGHAMYQCQAAMSNPHYVAVDDMGD